MEKFVTKAAEKGIDIFLIFDGLNDIRNCEAAAKAALKAGKLVEGNIQFTSSPVHTVDSFVKTAQEYVAIGATAVHLEDMGGMIDPVTAAKTVSAVKAAVSVPVHYHSHCTGGMTEITYWEVAKAGADVIDVDCSAMAMGTSHPAAESIISTVFLSMAIANIAMVFVAIFVAKGFAKILKMPYSVLGVIIFLLSAVGSYASTKNLNEIYIMVVFGIFGYFFNKYKFNHAALVLGLVLGETCEKNLTRALKLAKNNIGAIVTRPITAAFLLVILLMFLWPLIKAGILKARNRSAETTGQGQA